jgi:hypothetical protein
MASAHGLPFLAPKALGKGKGKAKGNAGGKGKGTGNGAALAGRISDPFAPVRPPKAGGKKRRTRREEAAAGGASELSANERASRPLPPRIRDLLAKGFRETSDEGSDDNDDDAGQIARFPNPAHAPQTLPALIIKPGSVPRKHDALPPLMGKTAAAEREKREQQDRQRQSEQRDHNHQQQQREHHHQQQQRDHHHQQQQRDHHQQQQRDHNHQQQQRDHHQQQQQRDHQQQRQRDHHAEASEVLASHVEAARGGAVQLPQTLPSLKPSAMMAARAGDGAPGPSGGAGAPVPSNGDGGAGPASGTDGGAGPASGTDGGAGPASGTDGGAGPASGTDGGAGPASGTDGGAGPSGTAAAPVAPDAGPGAGAVVLPPAVLPKKKRRAKRERPPKMDMDDLFAPKAAISALEAALDEDDRAGGAAQASRDRSRVQDNGQFEADMEHVLRTAPYDEFVEIVPVRESDVRQDAAGGGARAGPSGRSEE